MTRSPLAYPLNRAADTDVGGAADLQTDIMRFMAILSLCLVAIFALVQSIPLAPVEPGPASAESVVLVDEPAATIEPQEQQTVESPAPTTAIETERTIVLTRPRWVPRYPQSTQEPVASETIPANPEPVAETVAAAEPEQEGFTLRFASDAALTRAVAAHHVGLYAMTASAAKRMTVNESRISFWDASTPNAFHEMEAATVPAPVVDALARAGVETGAVNWGVTLPGKMTRQVETLMHEHSGGSLIIAATGDIHWEAPQ